MRARWMAIVLLLNTATLIATPTRAQSTQTDIAAKLIDKPLFLMGLWASDNLKFNAQGHPAGNYQTAPFTLCGFHVTKVSVRGSHLKLEGEREGIKFAPDGTMLHITLYTGGSGLQDKKPEKMSVEIDNGDSRDFTAAIDAVLTDDPKRLAPQLPEFWLPYFRKHFGELPAPAEGDLPHREVVQDKPQHLGRDVHAPKLLHSAEPEFSEDARRMKFSGNVQVYLWVDENGVPSHVSVFRPAGMGLDEKAIAAVRQYRFSPATQNGKPVTVDLYIDVNFQIF